MADRFEQLKLKYQSVLNFIQSQGMQMQNLNMEGDKLLIRASAPSADLKVFWPGCCAFEIAGKHMATIIARTAIFGRLDFGSDFRRLDSGRLSHFKFLCHISLISNLEFSKLPICGSLSRSGLSP